MDFAEARGVAVSNGEMKTCGLKMMAVGVLLVMASLASSSCAIACGKSPQVDIGIGLLNPSQRITYTATVSQSGKYEPTKFFSNGYAQVSIPATGHSRWLLFGVLPISETSQENETFVEINEGKLMFRGTRLRLDRIYRCPRDFNGNYMVDARTFGQRWW